MYFKGSMITANTERGKLFIWICDEQSESSTSKRIYRRTHCGKITLCISGNKARALRKYRRYLTTRTQL